MMRISRMLYAGSRRRIGVGLHPPSRQVSCDVLWEMSSQRSFGTTRSVGLQTRQKTDDSAARTVRIGSVERKINPKPPASPHLIPVGYLPSEQPSQSVLSHLQWIMSKDNLGQDMLLVGPPGDGATYRRRLAFMYAELMGREVEVVTLSSDVTESDLKQRRELRFQNGLAQVDFSDQAPVRAAIHGRILILDGLETAERNVLPTLNNLLENREMHLEDGRCLVGPGRLLDLKERNIQSSSILFPTHEDFRVIALAVPAPPFEGQSLDPPLRSRFQIRRVDNATPEELYEQTLNAGVDDEIARQYAKFAGAMETSAMSSTANETGSSRILMFPSCSIPSIAKVVQTFDLEDPCLLLSRSYPVGIDSIRASQTNDLSRKSFSLACENLAPGSSSAVVQEISSLSDEKYDIEKIDRDKENPLLASVAFKTPSGASITVKVPCGMGEIHPVSPHFIHTVGSKDVLKAMMQEHFVDRDILLVSKKGQGKTVTAMEFASILGYTTQVFGLYKDMTSRDLLMRRTTDSITGETSWEASPLLKAAVNGDICILDGVDQLGKDTLSTLQSLVHDRELSLPNGQRLVCADRFDKANHSYPHFAHDNVLSHQKGGSILPVHDSFRIIALGSVTENGAGWLTENAMSMFSTIPLPPPSHQCLKAILKASSPLCPEDKVNELLDFHNRLTEPAASDCAVSPLSTRNLVRIVKQIQPSVGFDSNLYEVIVSVLMGSLLPPTQKQSLDNLLNQAGIVSNSSADSRNEKIDVEQDTLKIGTFVMKRGRPKRPEMVPAPEFFDIPDHVQMIAGLLKEWSVGERAFLLIGNQGVGKNKIVDRLCEVANFEREYIQLHRDSTIGQLTLSPSLEDGKIIWKDSPLVRAVQEGCALVIDEADKAPLETVVVFKNLIEDGELLLADGRRITRTLQGPDTIPIHPNFSVWVLANRPGFPFHGNDFFREVGDCFSTHAIPNPDLESEIELLRSYATNIDNETLHKVVRSFGELRYLSEKGDISYPYSTREAVSIVKHLKVYPGLISALHNVLDMDSFDDSLYKKIGDVFRRNGIPMTDYRRWGKHASIGSGSNSNNNEKLDIQYSGSPPGLTQPKLGKFDENNEPHVGGNQWQGGTGGSDTAGLGGRGGPYRIDRGHKVHQVSDEAKAQVSKETAEAAKQMADAALKERLQEIGISETEWKMYDGLVQPIRADIVNLKGLLKAVESKKTERAWIKRQSYGEIDDAKLVDGATGDKFIYKRRGNADPQKGSIMKHPKRIRFVFDCSASMYRFNGYDERLNLSLEAAALIMESFDEMNNRFLYSIVGHSGDSDCIPLVEFGNPPGTVKDRMKILQKMVAHTQYCQSGDHTLEAMQKAMHDVIESDPGGQNTDECIVIGISDANLRRYGIRPRQLGDIMRGRRFGASENVPKSFCIFIASLGDEADEIRRELPFGRGFVCKNTKDLPSIVRDILSSLM